METLLRADGRGRVRAVATNSLTCAAIASVSAIRSVRCIRPNSFGQSVRLQYIQMYTLSMNVSITDLRAQLSRWIAEARDGQDVVITDRGVPVARITGLDSTSILERLTSEGVIGRPRTSDRPVAGGSGRPTPKRPVSDRADELRS